MGSISAMNSIDRVLTKHGDEIRAGLVASLSESTKGLVKDVILSNGCHHISVTAVLSNDTELELESIEIDQLAEDYPDCEVGY